MVVEAFTRDSKEDLRREGTRPQNDSLELREQVNEWEFRRLLVICEIIISIDLKECELTSWKGVRTKLEGVSGVDAHNQACDLTMGG